MTTARNQGLKWILSVSRESVDRHSMVLKLFTVSIFALIVSQTQVSSAQSPLHGFDDLNIHVAVAKDHTRNSLSPPLLIHFHGDTATVEKNFHASGLSGVLVAINCRGLSSAYRRPFENQKLFHSVLTQIKQQLVKDQQVHEDMKWGRIDLSCFSAGYGAVRELLKNADHVSHVDAVVAADSIHASIATRRGDRIVDGLQMQPFVDFARLAVTGEKFFLVSYSQLPVEDYASTTETARHLLTEVGLTTRQIASPQSSDEFAANSVAARQGLVLLGFPGSEGESHLKHLRHIARLWELLQNRRTETIDSGVTVLDEKQ